MPDFVLFDKAKAYDTNTSKPKVSLESGFHIRAHDFPGYSSRQAYIEGVIIDISKPSDDYWQITIKCTHDSMATKTYSRLSQILTTYYPSPLDQLWEYERIQILSQDQNHSPLLPTSGNPAYLVNLLDQLLPEFVTLSKHPESERQLRKAFTRAEPEKIDHLIDQWLDKQGDIGAFYINLDGHARRLLLHSFGVQVQADPIQSIEKRIKAQLSGTDGYFIYALEPYFLERFFVLANNNSIDLISTLTSGALLSQHLSESKVDHYGNGTNWASFYIYLFHQSVIERKDIVEIAYGYR